MTARKKKPVRVQHVRIKMDVLLRVEQDATPDICGPAFIGFSQDIASGLEKRGVNVTAIVKAKRSISRTDERGKVTLER